jgi:hypothetical protein
MSLDDVLCALDSAQGDKLFEKTGALVGAFLPVPLCQSNNL